MPQPHDRGAEDPAQDPRLAELTAELDGMSESPEFAPFAEHHQRLVDEVLAADAAGILREREQQDQETVRLTGAADTAHEVERRRRLGWNYARAGIGIVLVAAAGLLVLDWLGVLSLDLGWLSGTWQRIAVLSVIAVALGSLTASIRSSARPTVTLPESQLRHHERSTAAIRQVSLAEAYRRAINTQLASLQLAQFPLDTPELVELADAGRAPSRSIDYVSRFVAEHATSAIGIAGPRGSGKSTLIAAVSSSPDVLRILVPSAGRHSPDEILRRITFALERAVGSSDKESDRVHARRVQSAAVLMSYAWTIGLGLLAVEFFAPSAVTEMGPVGMFGAALLIFGVLGLLATLSRRPPISELLASEGAKGSQSARALARDLRVEVAEETETRASFTLAGWLGADHAAIRSGTNRALGYADLVDRLVDVLTDLGEEMYADGKRVIVAIDELDKASDPESLVQVINSIKDLFRIRNIHFLVSVSDEALQAFELRGLQPRDAFDSSFDTIVEIDRITSDEAVTLVNSRVTLFPPALTRVCHVWAGGLPRDLLRAVRGCVEIYHRQPAPWPDVARSFLNTDIDRRIMAIRRSGFIVNDEPETQARQLIDGKASITDILGQAPLPIPGLPLRSCLLLAADCGSALRLVERRPELHRHDVNELNLRAQSVADLSARALVGIAALRSSESAATAQSGNAIAP